MTPHRGRRRPNLPGRALALAAALLPPGPTALALPPAGPAGAGTSVVAATAFSDEALVTGFVVTVFGAETPGRAAAPRLVRKFARPVVRVHLVARPDEAWRASVLAFVSSLSRAVDNLTLVETADAREAEIVIFLVARADYAATVRRTAWRGVDVAFLEANACSAVLAARPTGIERAHVYLVADEGFGSLAHCMVEEIAQSLGPANDSPMLAQSIFNDRSELDALGVFDWFILNMLYDRRILPGMTEAQVLPLLPAVIADVRRRLRARQAGPVPRVAVPVP